MSPKLLAKVAKGAADLYEQALQRLRAPELRGHFDRCWADVVEWNCKLYLGLSQFHASFEHADAYEYGQQVVVVGVGVGGGGRGRGRGRFTPYPYP